MMAEPETFDPSSRTERIRAIVDRLLPDDVTCAAFDVDAACAAHPELAPELKLELCKAALIRGARARAGREVNPTAFETLSLSEECGTTATITRAGAPQDDDAAPVLIPGYEIIRELSHGGQGVVYEALQVSTKRKVALKVLLEGRRAGSPARRRFLREIELIAQLKHPNIIEIFEAGRSSDGQPFYVMDYVRGDPLHKHIRKHDLALNQVLRLFTHVCEAIQYAHQHGIIHRDLKPSNILVDSDGTPKVLDFGLAKPLHASDGEDALTISEQILGTLPYMAPEQTRGHQHEIDTRTDVYALGVILYELLTGQYPYPVAGQLADVLQHIASTPPDKPRRKWSTTTGILRRPSGKRGKSERCPIDDDLEVIILKALNKERERRYQSAGELGRDVQHFLAGEAIEAKRDSAWYVLRKLAGHHRYAAAVTLLVSISVIGFGCVSLYFYAEARRALEQMALSDQRVLENARDLDARGYEVMQRARDNNLGWFLLAWQSGLRDWAAELMAQTSTKAPERVAMRYLAEPGFSFDELLCSVPPEHAAMAQFVYAERALREGRRTEAIDAYRRATASGSRDWWRRVAEWRLRQLDDAGSAAPLAHAPEPEVTDDGRP